MIFMWTRFLLLLMNWTRHSSVADLVVETKKKRTRHSLLNAAFINNE